MDSCEKNIPLMVVDDRECFDHESGSDDVDPDIPIEVPISNNFTNIDVGSVLQRVYLNRSASITSLEEEMDRVGQVGDWGSGNFI